MGDSDWDFINDHMGGWDSDGMPNFMNSEAFYADQRKLYKTHSSQHIKANRTDQVLYEDGSLKTENTYFNVFLKSSTGYAASGNLEYIFSYQQINNHNNSTNSQPDKEKDTYFYEGGSKRIEINYLEGKQNLISWWNQYGELKSKLDCIKELQTIYDENGLKASKGQVSIVDQYSLDFAISDDYTNLKKNGEWITWHDNGWWSKENYVNNNLNGVFYRFDLIDVLREKGEFKNNKMHGARIIFDKNGQVEKEEVYKDGILK